MKSRSLILASLLLAAAQTAAGVPESVRIRAAAAVSGDLSGDGQCNVTDVRMLCQFLTGQRSELPDWQAGDINRDGRLNAADLTLLKRIAPQQEAEPAYIHLLGTSIRTEGNHVAVSGKTAVISASGSYYIDGTLDGGQILVNVPDETADTGTVKLFLNGVQITNTEAPCILIENAENTSVNLEEGTVSLLSDGSEAPQTEYAAERAVLHAKDDLTIKGSGTLEIQAGMQYGIHCNNDLKFNGASVTVTTLNEDAVRGKTSVTVKDGVLNIDAKGDGLKSTKGSLTVSGGSITVKSGKDAFQSETDMTLTGGTVCACGDRGLKAGGTVTADGCTLLATATDNPCENLRTTAQPALTLAYTKEWAKNNPVTLTDKSGAVQFEMNTRKKFRYALVSAPGLKTGTDYALYTGGIAVEHGGQSGFRCANPQDYTGVNNTDTAALLYAPLFDRSSVHKIEVEMPDSLWKDFLAHADDEAYYPCDVTIDGETLRNVGIRTKGNSSRQFVSQAHRDKYSFRIKFDKYDDYLNYHGLTEICMNNMYSDPSCMRDVLCYDVCKLIDAYAPECAYTDMYLNGQLYSFYFLAEQPGTTLGERLGTDDDAVLYKAADVIGTNGGYDCSFKSTMALENFEVKFGSDDSLSHIAELQQAINALNASNYKSIEQIMDVQSFLRGFAVNAAMCNYDSYNGQMAHNYYLVYSGGKMHYVCWDYNLSLGNFMDYGASVNSDIKTAVYQTTVSDRPLLKLLDIDEYRRAYEGYVKQIMQYYANPEQRVSAIAAQIRSHVQADPRFFFTADQFERNIAKSANGLQIGGGGGIWGGMWGFGDSLFSYGGENVSVVDFLIRRSEVIAQAIGT